MHYVKKKEKNQDQTTRPRSLFSVFTVRQYILQ